MTPPMTITTMSRRKNTTTFVIIFTSALIFASLSLYLSRTTFYSNLPIRGPPLFATSSVFRHRHFASFTSSSHQEQPPLPVHHHQYEPNPIQQQPPPPPPSPFVNTQPESLLAPAWMVFLIFPPDPFFISSSSSATANLTCFFQFNQTSLAEFAGFLPLSNRTTFLCPLPNLVRRRARPPRQPILTASTGNLPDYPTDSPPLHRWSHVIYESLSTADDVILFAKGVNSRQGYNRLPEHLRCVFTTNAVTVITTPVITSKQEVFRCLHPNFGGKVSQQPTKVALEVVNETRVVPSVAYYTPSPRSLANPADKSLLCACTMVYNVAKFLKEWVLYHSKIGIEKFILYDNDSDDDLEIVVDKLNKQGYYVKTVKWPWWKTQEAGFSHCAMYAKDTCTWMAYIDVDEFFYSPSWAESPKPSPKMLTSFLPKATSKSRLGQLWFLCYEFGPSSQVTHPVKGVTQGYDCRKKQDQRHKSIVLIDAIDAGLLTVIHHFELKKGYHWVKVKLEDGVVNHYKFQAWSEFQTKFRRRVSAYVYDWTKQLNPMSKDRTPGLGYKPIEPEGWARKFCEVHDHGLQRTARRWFGSGSSDNYTMAWQDE